MSLLNEARAALAAVGPSGPSAPNQDPSPDQTHQRPAFVPFPMEVMPDIVREFVESASSSLGCDPAFLACPAMAALSGAIGLSRALELKPGWQEPACLWVAVVADSGSMKSPALDAVLEPFWNVHNERNLDFQERMCEFERVQALYNSALRKGDSGIEKAPECPKLERAIVGDVTIQRMAEILADTPRGTICAMDELSGWFQNLTRYAGKGSDLPQWLSLQSGAPLQVDRKGGKKSLFVRRALASLVGGIQPGILKRHLSQDFSDSGASARFLLVCPPKRQKIWREMGIDPQSKARWARMINNLLELQGNAGPDGLFEPGVISLSPEARKLWHDFYESHAEAQLGASGGWASFLAKMEASCARQALVFCVADRISKNREDLSPVEPIWMEAGILSCQWWIKERARVEALLNAADPGAVSLADKIGVALRAAGPEGLSKTQISERLGRNFSRVEIDSGLMVLKNQSLAVFEHKETGGRPLEVWRAVGGFLPGN